MTGDKHRYSSVRDDPDHVAWNEHENLMRKSTLKALLSRGIGQATASTESEAMTPEANLAVAMQSLAQLIDVEAASNARAVVEQALRAARLEALEEAAKIAESHTFDGPTDPTNIEAAGRVVADAIRERARE